MDARGADILFAKDGHGFLANRIAGVGVAGLQKLAQMVGSQSISTTNDQSVANLGNLPAEAWFASLHWRGAVPHQRRFLYPTTGMRGLLLAAATCASLTPFGFTDDEQGSRDVRAVLGRFHYWEPLSQQYSLIHGLENITLEHLIVAAWRNAHTSRAESSAAMSTPLHVCLHDG